MWDRIKRILTSQSTSQQSPRKPPQKTQETSEVKTVPRGKPNADQTTIERRRRPVAPQLYLSKFWTALEDAKNSSSLKIVKIEGRGEEESIAFYEFPPLKCKICRVELGNSSKLESHILENHCTKVEQDLCRAVECVPNRVHEMVKKVLKDQEAEGTLKIQFMDAPNLYLSMPFNHDITKYLRLSNVQISLRGNRIRKSKQWRIFEMKNHEEDIVSVHVNFEPHIVSEIKQRRHIILKILMEWHDQTEEFIRSNYAALSPNMKDWIAELLRKEKSVEQLIAFFKVYEIFEKRAKDGYFIRRRKCEENGRKTSETSANHNDSEVEQGKTQSETSNQKAHTSDTGARNQKQKTVVRKVDKKTIMKKNNTTRPSTSSKAARGK